MTAMCLQLAPCLSRVLDHLTRKLNHYYYYYYYLKKKNSPSCVRILPKTLNLVISCCSFAQNGNEIYQKNARAEWLFC